MRIGYFFTHINRLEVRVTTYRQLKVVTDTKSFTQKPNGNNNNNNLIDCISIKFYILNLCRIKHVSHFKWNDMRIEKK